MVKWDVLYKSFMSFNPKGVCMGRVVQCTYAVQQESFARVNGVERLENEFWNHKMIGANHAGYTDRFHELAKLVPHLVTPESARIKRYMAGLAPEIRG
ncbi:hypothetical protein Tco_1229613 [Tanacetum coccineum]